MRILRMAQMKWMPEKYAIREKEGITFAEKDPSSQVRRLSGDETKA